jgi:hypothetical protein
VEELTGAMVRATWVRGNGIELVRELRWDVAMPMEHGIVGVGRRRWLRRSGGVGGRAEKKPNKQNVAVRAGKSSRRGLLDALRNQEEHGQAGAAAGKRRR